MTDYSSVPLDQLRARFLSDAEQYGEALRCGDYRTANPAHDRLVALAAAFRARGTTGEAIVLSLLDDGDPAVRIAAAVTALPFASVPAERALRDVASGPPSPVRLNAEMALREWQAGRLRPPGEA